jgi:TolB protein
VTRRISLPGLGTLTRRRAVCITAAAGMRAFAARPACAGVVIDPVVRFVQPVRIALPDFLADGPADAEPARAISQIIAANLNYIGQFAPIFPDWLPINAQMLVTGRVTRQPDGRIKVEFRLWDVFGGAQLTGQQYFSTPDNFHRIANIISDAIYERVTRENGNFDANTPP